MSHTDSPHANGVWEVKRTIRIPSLTHEIETGGLRRALEQLDGVKQVAMDSAHQRIEVRYDASRANYRSLIILLEEQGFAPAKNWWSHLKGNWYQFTDNNARENANLPPPSCCNKPPQKR